MKTRNSKLTRPPRHRMLTSARTRQPAERLWARKRPSRWWLGQGLRLTCLLLFCGHWCLNLAPAAIITGNLQTTSGNAYVTNALFAPLSTPLSSGTNIIASTQTNVIAAGNGSFSVALKQGNYLVTIGNLDRKSVV